MKRSNNSATWIWDKATTNTRMFKKMQQHNTDDQPNFGKVEEFQWIVHLNRRRNHKKLKLLYQQ